MDFEERTAEQIIRVALLGSTIFLKISGAGTLAVAGFLAAAASGKAKTSGQVRLKTLLQSGAELKVFTMQGDANFEVFAREAKTYGILYSVVRRTDTEKEQQIYDIMVRAIDAGKLNRVIEKYHLVEVEATAMPVEAPAQESTGQAGGTGRNEEILDVRDLHRRLLERPQSTGNPTLASEEERSLSGASLRMPNQEDRKSVVAELNQYIEEAAVGTAAVAGLMPNLMGEEFDEEKHMSEIGEEMLSGIHETKQELG